MCVHADFDTAVVLVLYACTKCNVIGSFRRSRVTVIMNVILDVRIILVFFKHNISEIGGKVPTLLGHFELDTFFEEQPKVNLSISPFCIPEDGNRL